MALVKDLTEEETTGGLVKDLGTGIPSAEVVPEASPRIAVEEIPAGVDMDKVNRSMKNAQALDIPPSQAFDMDTEIVEQQNLTKDRESSAHAQTKVSLKGDMAGLSPETKSILNGEYAIDPFGIRGLFEASIQLGAGMASWLASFPSGAGELISQLAGGGGIDISRIADRMEEVTSFPSEVMEKFPELQPKTLSGQQWTEVITYPFQVYFERGVAPMEEYAAETLGTSDENKEDIRGAVRILANAALLIIPKAAKKGVSKVFKSDFYRRLTIKERGLVVVEYETLRKQGFTEAQLARMNPDFFKRALERRKETLVDVELARVEEKPVTQVIKERAVAKEVIKKETAPPVTFEESLKTKAKELGIAEHIAETEKINSIQRDTFGDMVKAGKIDEAVKHAIEGVEKFDKQTINDAIVAEEVKQVAEAPKEEREAIKENFKTLKERFNEAVIEPLGTEQKAGVTFRGAQEKIAQEIVGENILEELIEQEVTPKQLTEQFLEEVLPNITEQAEQRFIKSLERQTGLSVGDQFSTDPNDIIKDIPQLARFFTEDFRSLESLEGSQRGFFVLMSEAIRKAQLARGVVTPEVVPTIERAAGIREELKDKFKVTEGERGEIEAKKLTKLELQKKEFQARVKKVEERSKAKIDKIKTEKEKIARRRQFVRGAQEQFGLSDADIKKISGRDIRLMNDFEFKKFLDDYWVKASELQATAQAKAELHALIQDKQFKGWDNLRKALKLPPVNKMNEAQAIKLYDELKDFQQEDVFLTTRKLELINRTDFKGAKTIRQILENAHKVTDIPVSELEKTVVTEFDRFKPHTMLAKASPFFEYVVTKFVTRQLGGDANYLKVEKEITVLANKARKSRNLTTKDKISNFVSPQDLQVMEYLEASKEQKAVLAKDMTAEEIDYANYMESRMTEALEYLIENEVIKSTRFEGAYITHVRKKFIESVKDDGLKAGVKNLFEKFEHDEQVFNILEQSTGDILALEKFLPQSLFRTGKLDPTKNTARAFLNYWRTLETKKALDSVIPEIDALVYALEPKKMTPKGLKADKSLEKFFKEWINAQKGRAPKLLIKQGGKVDITLRALKTFTTLKDLAFNIPVQVASGVGEAGANFIQLGHKNVVKGQFRKRTSQGQLILDKYEHFIGKSVWQELTEADKDIADKANLILFGMFHHNMVSANKTFLLGSLTEAEFESGVISDKRLAQLKLNMGEYRQTIGSESIIGKTPEGKTFNQYKKWAVPILQSTFNNIKNIFKNKDFTSKEAWQLYRSLELLTAVAIVGALFFEDEDDPSLAGKVVRKGYREAMSVLGALDHSFWIAVPRALQLIKDIMKGLIQLITLKEYQQGNARHGIEEGDLKGIRTLKKQVTPAAISQFESKKTSKDTKKKSSKKGLKKKK